MIIYIIEEKHRIFDLLKGMLSGSDKYIFVHEDAEFSDDILKYIKYNEILMFKLVSPSGSIVSADEIDLAVFGSLKNSELNINLEKVKTFLFNIDNMDKLKNIDLSKSQVITCGLHEKDTVIFSSTEADGSGVMLELQRSIINIKDKSTEPFEKKIILERGIENEGTEDILFTLAVLMYCGRLK